MQQAITWANVVPDLCHHMAAVGYSELTLQYLTSTWIPRAMTHSATELTHWGRDRMAAISWWHFHEWNYINFDYDFAEVCSLDSN